MTAVPSINSLFVMDPLLDNSVVIQCPKCRHYWDKRNSTWLGEHCSWGSHELTSLCLSQLPHDPRQRSRARRHPHFTHASQKCGSSGSSGEYSNIIQIRVSMQYRACCCDAETTTQQNTVTTTTTTSTSTSPTVTFAPLPQLQQNQTRETDYYFTVKYYLCERCAENRSASLCSTGPAVKDFHTVIIDQGQGKDLQPPSVRKLRSFGITLEALNVDCVSHLVTFLSPSDLRSVAVVNASWYGVARAELLKLERFMEAWNAACRVGVYVNLDYLDDNDESHKQYSERGALPSVAAALAEEVHVGGYLQLLPMTEIKSEELPNCVNNPRDFHIPAPSARGKSWHYATPNRTSSVKSPSHSAVVKSSSSSLLSLTSDKAVLTPTRKEPTLTVTLLQSLPLSQQTLLKAMTHRFRLVSGGGPLFTKGKVLFPYIVAVATSGATTTTSTTTTTTTSVTLPPEQKDHSDTSKTAPQASVLPTTELKGHRVKPGLRFFRCYTAFVLSC